MKAPTLPLQGVTVVALEQAVAAPLATRQLADLGARVIKIERPGAGDFARHYDQTVLGQSSHFVWLNRSKESLALDLKQPRAAKVLERLLSKADVFIQNLAPGAAGRLGLNGTSLHQRYPSLVSCSISGYGEGGPYADKKAYDLLVQCEAGALSITGTPETPSKTGISIADIAAGMYAYSGILTALLARERGAGGTYFEVSMLEALGEWMGYPGYYTAYGGQSPARTGASHATIFPYGPFTVAEGRQVFFGIQNEREWQQFCALVLQMPAMGNDPRFISNSLRFSNQQLLRALIEQQFSAWSVSEVIRRLDAAGIANARLNTPQEFWNHPQLAARMRWRQFNTPGGPVDALIPPVQFPDMPVRMDAMPAVGEHTEMILAELGLDAQEIARLCESKGT